jgi:GDP-mannose 6-dehydrogenase
LRALLHQARHNDVELEMLQSVLPSNQQHIQRALDMIIGTGKTRIGVLGLAFKAETDDVRESPMVLLVEQLLGKGCRIQIHDPQLSLGRVLGANREYLETHIPHIASLLVEGVEEMREQEVLVVGQRNPIYAAAPTDTQIVIDLIGAFDSQEAGRGPDVRSLV